jgi:hypothetical protein
MKTITGAALFIYCTPIAFAAQYFVIQILINERQPSYSDPIAPPAPAFPLQTTPASIQTYRHVAPRAGKSMTLQLYAKPSNNQLRST